MLTDLIIYILGNMFNLSVLCTLIGAIGLCLFTFWALFAFDNKCSKFWVIPIMLLISVFFVQFLCPSSEVLALIATEQIETTYTPEQISKSTALQKKLNFVQSFYKDVEFEKFIKTK